MRAKQVNEWGGAGYSGSAFPSNRGGQMNKGGFGGALNVGGPNGMYTYEIKALNRTLQPKPNEYSESETIHNGHTIEGEELNRKDGKKHQGILMKTEYTENNQLKYYVIICDKTNRPMKIDPTSAVLISGIRDVQTPFLTPAGGDAADLGRSGKKNESYNPMRAKTVNEYSPDFYKNSPFGNSPAQRDVDRENVKKARMYDTEDFWIQVAQEMGVELDYFDLDEEGRDISFRMRNGDIMSVAHSWKHDGSPTKPVTYIDGKNIGRFSIWDNPKDTAEDYLELWDEYTKYDDEIDESLNEGKFKDFFTKGEKLDNEVPYRINDDFVEYKTPRGWNRFKFPRINNKTGEWGYSERNDIVYIKGKYDRYNYLTLHDLMFGDAGLYKEWLDINKEIGIFDLMMSKKDKDYDLDKEAPKLFKQRFPTPASYYEWFDKKQAGLRRMWERRQERENQENQENELKRKKQEENIKKIKKQTF